MIFVYLGFCALIFVGAHIITGSLAAAILLTMAAPALLAALIYWDQI